MPGLPPPIEVAVDGRPVTVVWAPGPTSALDGPTTSDGRDVGQTGVFVSVAADGTRLSFTRSEDDPPLSVDEQTGSSWNLVGEAVSGPRQGERVEQVAHDDTFWFVWFVFQPATELIGGIAG